MAGWVGLFVAMVYYLVLNLKHNCCFFFLVFAVILRLCGLLRSQISCTCYCFSQWKALVSKKHSICNHLLIMFYWLSEILNLRFGQPIKVNWAYASTQRADTSGLPPALPLTPTLLPSRYIFYIIFRSVKCFNITAFFFCL